MKIIEPKVELINSPAYFDLLSLTELAGRTCYKSEANIREWRHFLRLRTSPAAHPDMRVVAHRLLDIFKARYPVFFEDIEV